MLLAAIFVLSLFVQKAAPNNTSNTSESLKNTEIYESNISSTSTYVDANNTNNEHNATVEPSKELVVGTLKVHFIDQTTPNMIQILSHLFVQKPLILKEI